MQNKVLSAYRKVQAQTAGPGQRVVMVYDGIIKNLKGAIEGLGDLKTDNIEKIHNHIQLAERLVLELRLALDKEKGGELSKTLDNLYDFWIRQLSDGNVKKDPKLLEPVLKMAQELRDGWAKAAEEFRKTSPPSGQA